MKEYIDKQELLKELRYDLKNDCNIYHSHIDKEIRDEKYEFAIDVVQDVSAADVRKVVHGKWLSEYPVLESNPMFACVICSECGAITPTKTNYCHNCGATMDLKLELTEYEEKCLFCKHNYKPLNCIPKCNRMCDHYSDFELIENIKEKFK